MAELREGQRIRASVAFKTASGNPAAHEAGSVIWESSDPSIASVTADPANELEADIDGVNGADNGSVVVSCSADGDPDADQVRALVATADITVTQGEAVVSEISLGSPADIPVATP